MTTPADPSPRIQAAEQRSALRRSLEASSLGDPEVRAAIARHRQYVQALPDRWVRVADLPRLLSLYRDRREIWGESHAVATAHVLVEADYEPDQADLDQ